MPRLNSAELKKRFLTALEPHVERADPESTLVLTLEASAPLPPRIRVYLFNATHPPGGRSTPEHKIQLMVPGQRRDERANFDFSDGRAVIVAGYAEEHDVWILWDATLHRDFAFSKNAQVRTETVEAARTSGEIAMQVRLGVRLGPETVIAAPTEHLVEAVVQRFKGAPFAGQPAGVATPTTQPTGGTAYVPPSREHAAESVTRVFEVDPDVIDRGTTAHKDLQDALATALRKHGIEPLSPLPGDPKFDVAWRQDRVAFVAEVKSLTDANEERQLRLGLGQVLSYVHLLDWADVDDVRGVLAVERKPIAEYWTTLCPEHDVLLTWPASFDDLFLEPE